MSYLTEDEQKEVSLMEHLFDSEGYKTFLRRAASPDHIKTIQERYSSVSDMRELGFLQGQERVINQVMTYSETYMATIQSIEEQREDDAKIEGIESEEDNLANA